MKKWEAATIESIEITETAFGLNNPEIPDGPKTQTTKPDGTQGWSQDFGGNNGSI